MFKKLKEKNTEEVTSSSQRFAEFTQSDSDRFQNSTNCEDNFICTGIGKDDENTSANNSTQGFSNITSMSSSEDNRARRLSNSSLASDISFLPRYEAGNMYHLQSDLDISTSEVEDNVSTTPSQMGDLTKEQIYSAFQKSQMRYQKYRGRYTDLAKHYKDLEREIEKIKSVLVETQDKAIGRVTKLREQCNLEQSAKGHLESVLRDEIDKRNYKIKFLQTKIEILQNDNGSSSLSIETKETDCQSNLQKMTKHLNEARKEIEVLNEKIQELKANSIVGQSKEQKHKSKICDLEKEIKQYAEGKNTKLESLQNQNKKVIDKVEHLTQKCNGLENELVKVHSYKIELENSRLNEETLKKQIEDVQKLNSDLVNENEQYKKALQAYEKDIEKLSENITKERKEFQNQIESLREDAKKGLLSLEPKIREKLQQECLQKEKLLTHKSTQKLNALSSSTSSVNEVKMQIFEKDQLLKKHEALESARIKFLEKSESYDNLKKNNLERIEDCTKLRNTVASLEKGKIFVEYERKILQLDANIKTLQDEIEHLKELAQKKEEENVYLSNENMNLERVLTNVNGKLRLLEEKYEAVGINSSENKLLELKLQKLEEENNNLQGEFEMERKMFNDMLEDHNELKEKERHLELVKNELKDRHDKVIQLKQLLAEEKENNIKLDDKKLQLEKKIHLLIKKMRILEEKDETEHMDKAECGILEMKLTKLENDNQALLLSFQQEREVFERDIQSLRQELPSPEQSQKSANEKHLLTDIQMLNAEKEKEIVYLSEENSKLQQTNSKLSKKLRLLQCKYETLHVDSNECSLLELKLKMEEEENNRLKAEFEMERKVFNDLLENHKEIHEKDRFIEKLEHKLRELHVEINDLQDNLKIEKERNIQLEQKKNTLENEILKIGEHNKILEEKDDSLNMDRTECRLIKMKLRGSEKENENLLQIFEEERIVFDKVYKEKSVQEKEVKHLLSEINDMKEQLTEKEQEEI